MKKSFFTTLREALFGVTPILAPEDTLEKGYKYGCLMAKVPHWAAAPVFDWVAGTLTPEQLAAKGIEEDLHITVKYGLVPPPDGDWDTLKAQCTQIPPLHAKIGALAAFTQHPDFDVLYASVISTDLTAANSWICGSFECVDTHPLYIPHLTLAYLKKGEASRYIGQIPWKDGDMDVTFRVMVLSADNERSYIPLAGPYMPTRFRSIGQVPWPVVTGAARYAHRALAALGKTNGGKTNGETVKAWEELTPGQRADNYAGAAAVLNDGEMLPERIHDIWRMSKMAQGWTYGPKKDEAKKLHPNLVPYSELSALDQSKDVLFIAAVRRFVTQYVGLDGIVREVKDDPEAEKSLASRPVILQKSQVKGYYRTDPRTHKQVFVAAHDDRRTLQNPHLNRLNQPHIARTENGTITEKYQVKGGTKERERKNWVYHHSETGERVDDATSARIQDLRIPDSWTDVRVDLDPHAKLQAEGTAPSKEGKGAYQAKWNSAHIDQAAQQKWARLAEFSRKLPGIRQRIKADLHNPDPEIRHAARCLYLIDKTGIRVGSTEGGKGKEQSFGATTLKNGHVKVRGNNVNLNFRAKNGATNIDAKDAKLAEIMREHTSGPADKNVFDVPYAKVMKYFKSIGGGDHKIHDFRGYHATRLAAEEIAKMPVPQTEKELAAAKKTVAAKAARFVNDTPAVALSSYITPGVWHHWEQAVAAKTAQQSAQKPAQPSTARAARTTSPKAAKPSSAPPANPMPESSDSAPARPARRRPNATPVATP